MKRRKKVVSLHDHNATMELLKQLYGNYEVKDDIKNSPSKRETRAESDSEVVNVSSDIA